jgi:hypothetical protein
MKVQGGRMVPAGQPDARRQAYMAAFRNVSPAMVEAQGAMSDLLSKVSQLGVATTEEMRALQQADQMLRKFINSIVERNGR